MRKLLSRRYPGVGVSNTQNRPPAKGDESAERRTEGVLGDGLRTDLIVDGGPENMNHIVDTFVARAEVNIHRKIALKEVLFSNSMVEATNKILKYRYLLPKEAANTAALIKAVDWFVHDMNAVRPHGDLDGLTPDEAYLGLKPDIPDLDEQRRIAREHRLELNTTTSCGKCL